MARAQSLFRRGQPLQVPMVGLSMRIAGRHHGSIDDEAQGGRLAAAHTGRATPCDTFVGLRCSMHAWLRARTSRGGR